MNDDENLNKRDAGIDAMRFAACCAVVGIHTINRNLSPVGAVLHYACAFAVPVFFMASGAFLLNRGVVGYPWVKERLLQFVRVLLLWSIACALLDYFGTLFKGGTMTISSACSEPLYLFSASLLGKGMLSHCWFLWALAVVYLVLPPLSRVSHKMLVAILVVALSVSFVGRAASIVAGHPVESGVRQTLRIWIWLSYFILGGLLYPLRERKLSVRKLITFSVVLSIAAVSWQLFAGSSLMPESAGLASAEYFYGSPVTVLWCVSLFCLAISVDLSSDKWPHLASLTMGVYLLHLFVLRLVGHYFSFANVAIGSGIGFCMVLVVTFVMVGLVRSYLPRLYKLFFTL